MSYIQLIEDGDTRAFRAGDSGSAYSFRTDEDGELLSAYRKAVGEALLAGALGSLSEVERDMARVMADEVGIRKDASGGVYLYWRVPPGLAASLVDLTGGAEGTLAAEDLHLTIHYLGQADDTWDLDHIAAVCKIFSKRSYCLDGTVSGIGRFVGAEEQDILVALVDIEGLIDWRRCLEDELLWSGAVPSSSTLFDPDHGYVPHITLAYVAKGEDVSVKLPAALPLCIDCLSMGAGDVSVDFPFPMYEEDDAAEDAASFIPYYASVSGRSMDHLSDAVLTSPAEVFADMAEHGTKSAGDTAAGLSYAVTKSEDEKRYTLGPLYAPDRKDAHGEWTDSDTLQNAVWEYVRESSDKGRRLNLQHGDFGDITVGEWVEVMAWPYEHEITLKQADGTEVQQTMPAGTVYLGVVWDEAAWPEVKKGNLSGYSLGGMAVKVVDPDTDLDVMGWAAKAAAKGEADAKPMEPHAYEDGGDGMCKLCGKTSGAGNHTTAAADAAAKKARDEEIATAVKLAVAEERERFAAEQAAEEARSEDRSLIAKLVDGLGRMGERPLPDMHVHLPEQNVTIHEALEELPDVDPALEE